MIRVLVKQGRGLFVVVALLAIAVAACSSGGSSATGTNAPGNGGTNQPGASGGTGFASGLSSNLNNLDSYKFSWSVMGSDSSSPSDTGSGGSITGTVINKPTKASLVNYFGGAVYITIGTDQWISTDNGTTWMVSPTTLPVDTFLPTGNYATYFDAFAQTYKQVGGTENKNGVDCFHFQGDLSALQGLFATYGGVANMHADIWIAKNGNYPVSGSFGFSYAAGTNAGSYGYQFDITNINDSANKVEKPANVTALPS
jgi:hypothetical protein